MAIKRGVSLYSYQQEQFFGQMDWKAQIKEVHDNLRTDGIEIINESVIPQYPFPSEVFIADWNETMARYNMKAITMDVYLDTMRFRDHVMNYAEAAELLKMDIKLAAAMGFQNVRCLCTGRRRSCRLLQGKRYRRCIFPRARQKRLPSFRRHCTLQGCSLLCRAL